MSCEVDHAEWPRRAAITMAPHDIPLGSTPHVDGQHPTADEDSFWSRITSVSRRSLARIYGFLTGNRMSGSTTEAARVPKQGTLKPNDRRFSPPPPPGGGGCAGPPP